MGQSAHPKGGGGCSSGGSAGEAPGRQRSEAGLSTKGPVQTKSGQGQKRG